MNKSFIRSKINTIENIIFESSSANITESKKVQYEYELLNIFELLFATQLSDVESQNYCDYMNKSLSEEDLNQVKVIEQLYLLWYLTEEIVLKCISIKRNMYITFLRS